MAFRIAGGALLLYLGFFAVLSADALVRLWAGRAGMERPIDAALLLSYQGAQACATLLAVVLCTRLLFRADTPHARALVLLLVFAAIAHAKAFAFSAYPGRLQSWIASWLFGAGFPREAARLIFGEPAWAVWLALGALLRVAATFPRDVQAEWIRASGRGDRRGMMRSVALAGLDVGAFWRRTTAAVVRRGGLRAAFVWPFAMAAGFAPYARPLPGGSLAAVVLFAAGGAIAITLLRAGATMATRLERRRLLWVTQAAISALAAFTLVGVLALRADVWSDALAFAITGIAPLAVVFGAMLATGAGRPPPATPAIRRTLLAAGVALVAAVAWVGTGPLVSVIAGPDAGPLFSLGIAIGAGLLLLRPLRARLGNVVLLRPL